MPTTASVFLNALAQAGITHAFVNWGNDHPGILEELERQRVENGGTAIQIVTCPHEMVALSAAQGFTQVTGVPSAVIVHVDVGTQVGIPHFKNISDVANGVSSRVLRGQYIMWTDLASLF